MTTAPLISVVVPVLNDEAFLSTALRSLADQSLDDIEIVISDDCSQDGSTAIARRFVDEDSRFRLLAHPDNVGMTRNWNRALRETRGMYVVKLDADDAFRHEALERLAFAMESSDRPLVAYCRTTSCDAVLQPVSPYLGEQILTRAGIDPLQAHSRPGHDWYALSFDDAQLWHSNAQMHKREELLRMGGWDESWGCASDTDLILRVLERNEVIMHVPYVGALYRHRPGSVSDQYRKQAWLAWESALLHMDSLSRYHRAGGTMTTRLRKSWWRHWSNWTALRAQGEEALGSLRPDLRQRLLQRGQAVPTPPWPVRIEGQFRQSAWNLLRGRPVKQA